MRENILAKLHGSLFIVIACLGWLFMVMPAVAEGDGSGAAADEPLTLVSSVPADIQLEVAVNTTIKLIFNKNVINLTVRDGNRNCFTLSTTDGSQEAIEVIMADDQLYPEEKRNITIKPLEALQAGTGYILRIAPQLQAKNGTSLGHEITIRFTTAAPVLVQVDTPRALDSAQNEAFPDSGVSTPVETKAAANPTIAPSGTPTTPSIVVQSGEVPMLPGETATQNQLSKSLFATVAGFLIAAIPVYFLWRRRNKK